MSVKIYYGYRFKKKHLHEFTTTFRDAHYQVVLHHVRKICASNFTRLDTWNDKIQACLNLSSDAAASSHRTPMFDIECGWKLFFPPNSLYVLAYPYGENPVAGDRVKHPEWLEHYGYWDNTDRPESVTARQWSKRKKDWKIYTQPSGQNYGLILEVVNLKDGISSFSRASLYVDLQKLGEPCAIDKLAAVVDA
jgi:hypothetical protein